MAMNYAYTYAEIDPASGMCIQVLSRSSQLSDAVMAANNLVELEVNDPEYLMKYYIDGNWYEDAEGTIPWQSSLL